MFHLICIWTQPFVYETRVHIQNIRTQNSDPWGVPFPLGESGVPFLGSVLVLQ